jgi:hypothetical protein
MDFEGRIKKEMTEGIVRAILDDAGYRVIDYGLEKTVREVTPMSLQEVMRLALPNVMRNAPDLFVLDRDQSRKWLVEIKYRSNWNRAVLESLEAQVREYEEIVLVSVFANAPTLRKMHKELPSRYLRCCRLRYRNDRFEVEIGKDRKTFAWEPVASVPDDRLLWWKMRPIQELFPQIGERAEGRTLINAITAIRGILKDDGVSQANATPDPVSTIAS